MEKNTNQTEVEKFEALAQTWWDEDGPFRPLHRFNPCRMKMICEAIHSHFSIADDKLDAFSGLSMLDIGCGGGLVTEPLARLGASISGIDLGPNNIEAAKRHALKSELAIDYECISVASKLERGKKYDVVLSLEVIEHVDDVAEFVRDCAGLVSPRGMIILSSINRTLLARVLAIEVAEKVLRWLPRGTHDWSKLVKPEEAIAILEAEGFMQTKTAGVFFNPLRNQWVPSNNTDVNYLLFASRE